MSNLNIKRAIENIRSNTTSYTPVIEMIVNAIQAIDEIDRNDGKVQVRVRRDNLPDLIDNLPEVTGFEIEDNGIGFNDEHRNSFDTLYTDLKIDKGGKGFGRFTALKYFEELQIKSVYCDGDAFNVRSFSMGKDHDIIVREEITKSNSQDTGTVVTLDQLKTKNSFEKKLSTIARNLVERLLPYFITHGYVCPDIMLSEQDGSGVICLNDFVDNELSAMIKEVGVEKKDFRLNASTGEEGFLVRVFKFYSPRNQKSRISLVAHKREVSGSALHNYIPEFIDEFFEKDQSGKEDRTRNYIIKTYVFGHYLDRHVSLERGGFEFEMESDLFHEIGQKQIEQEAAAIAHNVMGVGITSRQEKKKEQVQSYVDEKAPWHKEILKKIDLSSMSYNPSNEEIEMRLQKEKFEREISVKHGIDMLMAKTTFDNVQDTVIEIVNSISDTSKNDLIHYVVQRRKILDIFGKSLETDKSGAYSSEGVVHDIIFPRKGDTETTSFHDHNLWIVDERLNFTSYISSDTPLSGGNSERPDLLIYNKRVLFRADNEASNPITIFEFKKPQRDDFVNPSSHEDPVQQIVRYVNDIRDGKHKTPEGRKMLVAQNTPFYGYVVCDLTPKIENWLDREKNFKPMPDQLGWFQWMENINLYIEVLSWDKLLKDSKMRNQIFFHKLGI